MLADHVRRMAANNAWSNHRLQEVCSKLSAEAYRARRTSFFPSIELTLNHILLVDWYYLDALHEEGRALELYALREVPCADRETLRQAQAAADRKLLAFCAALGEDDLERIVVLVRANGQRYPERVQDVLAHLFVHDIHHRGQVHAMLSGTEVAPPQLDEFFLAQDRDLRQAELGLLGLA